jgi:DNA-binding transcriptional LysR family regulator
LADFCKEPFVVRDAGSNRLSFVERTLAERGLTIRPALSLGSTEAVKRAVVAGLGCAIVPRLTVKLELNTRQLIEVKLPDLVIKRPCFRYQLKGRQPSKAAQAFHCLLEHAVRGTLPPPKDPSTALIS